MSVQQNPQQVSNNTSYTYRAEIGNPDQPWYWTVELGKGVRIPGGQEEIEKLAYRVANDSIAHLDPKKNHDCKIVICKVQPAKASARFSEVIQYQLHQNGKLKTYTTSDQRIDWAKRYNPVNTGALLTRFHSKFQVERKKHRGLRKAIERFCSSSSSMNYPIPKADDKLMKDICEVGPSDALGLKDALGYMIHLLGREDAKIANPHLLNRLQGALDLIRRRESLIQGYNSKDFRAMVKDIQVQMANLPADGSERCLIPCGYHHCLGEEKGYVWVELLLEVSRNDDETVSATLISGSKYCRDLFDTEKSGGIHQIALRRKIADVPLLDMQAIIPMLMEIQISKKELDRDVLLRTLNFPNTVVTDSKMDEPIVGQISLGHMGELITYVRSEILEKADQIEAERFEMALRLRLFLDVAKRDSSWLLDQQYRELVRTTAYHILNVLDQERDNLIGNDKKAQGNHLTGIVLEIKDILKRMEDELPNVIDLRNETVSEISLGQCTMESIQATPKLFDIPLEVDPWTDVDPHFAKFDPNQPLGSLQSWAARCQAWMNQANFQQAAAEATVMLRQLLPASHNCWGDLQPVEASMVLEQLQVLGEAIARGSIEKEGTYYENAIASAALTLHAFSFGQRATPLSSSHQAMAALCLHSRSVLEDLLKGRVTSETKNYVSRLLEGCPGPISRYQAEQALKSELRGGASQTVTQVGNLAAMAAIAAGEVSASSKEKLQEVGTYNFNLSLDGPMLQASVGFSTSFKWPYEKPTEKLSQLAPVYAENVKEEILNRYATELCPLGCIRDNCPNYLRQGKENHQYFPLYMLSHFTNTYCPELFKEHNLNRDEIADLLLTQQTNRDAHDLWNNHHNQEFKFKEADGFTEDDRRIQVVGVINTFFRHPNFLKHPQLRWLLESKILNEEYLACLFKPDVYAEHKPFLLSSLNLYQNEIAVGITNGNVEVAAYLTDLCDRIAGIIQRSELPPIERKELLAQIKYTPGEHLIQWCNDFAARQGYRAREQQKHLLLYASTFYYNQYCKDAESKWFTEDKHLEMIAYTIGHLDHLLDPKDRIDPEVTNRFHNLRALMLPIIAARLNRDEDNSSFVNGVLNRIEPELAEVGLTWDTSKFPLCEAMDHSVNRKYQFDLSTGSVYSGGARLEMLTDGLRQDPVLQHLYGSYLEEMWQISGAPNIENSIRITAYSHEKLVGQRIVVRQEVDEKGRPTDQAPQISVERKVIDENGDSEWAGYVRFAAQDMLANGENLSRSDLPPVIAAAIGGRSCWVNLSGNRVYVFDGHKNHPYATMKISRHGKAKKGRIKEFAFSKNRRLVSTDQKNLESFSPVEDPQFTMVIGKDGFATRVEYPRLRLGNSGTQLAYTLTPSGTTTKAYPQYRLAPLGTRPGNFNSNTGTDALPATFDQFHILQKKGKPQVVLIPCRQMVSTYNRAGDRLPKLQPVAPMGFDPSTVFEYTVDKSTNRLKAKSGDAYAYLAYISYVHHDYESAIYYLKKTRTSMGYTDNYDQIFEWIDRWVDEDDSGHAMNLHFALFKERVLEDRRVQKIRLGEKALKRTLTQDRIDYLGRVIHSYEAYSQSIQSRQVGDCGFDPLLDLSEADESQIQDLCEEFLAACGNSDIKVKQPRIKFKRAVPPPPPLPYQGTSKAKLFGEPEDALLLWAYSGDKRHTSTLALKNPGWVLHNFRHLFNKMLKMDKDSLEFKELTQRIRDTAEASRDNVKHDQRTALIRAEAYLLRLAEAIETGNLRELTAALAASHNKLPRLHSSSLPTLMSPADRIQFAKKRKLELTTLFGMGDPEDIILQIDELLQAEEEMDSEGNVKRTKSVAHAQFKQLRDFCLEEIKMKTKADEQGEERSYAENGFRQRYQTFFKEMLYGSDGVKMIGKITPIINALQKIKLRPRRSQVMAPHKTLPLPQAPAPQTYQSRFGKLLPGVGVSINYANASGLEADIEELENELFQMPVPQAPDKVPTLEIGPEAIFSEATVDRLQSFYTVVEDQSEPVCEKVFDDLVNNGEPVVQRQAEDHRADMKAFQADKKEYIINRGQAELFKQELLKRKAYSKATRARLKRQLLQYVDRFNTPAGILAVRRLTGRSAKITLDTLVNIWRTDDIASHPWQDNPLRKLGLTELLEDELQELDFLITDYLESSVELFHMDRVLDTCSEYIESCGDNPEFTGDPETARRMIEDAQTRRYYSFYSLARPVTPETIAASIHIPEVHKRVMDLLLDQCPDLNQQIQPLDPLKDKEEIADILLAASNEQRIQKLINHDPELHRMLLTMGNDRDFRDLLFIEHSLQIVLRKAQVKTVRDMLSDPDAVRQLRMGGGKSKVLLPILAKRKASGSNLVMLMLPQSLYETNCRDLDASSRELFGQGIFRFDFNRHSDRSVQGLSQTYLCLLRTMRDKGFVTTTKGSMLSFRNAFSELFFKLSEIPKGQELKQKDKIEKTWAQLEIMAKILRLFQARGDVISDEVDACLDVRKEVNFAIGGKQVIDSIVSMEGAELMELTLNAEEDQLLAQLGEAIYQNTQASISPSDRVTLLSELAGAFYDRYYRAVKLGGRQEFINYMMNIESNSNNNNNNVSDLPSFMKRLKKDDPERYRQIATVKAFLNRGFGTTLGRIGNVNYGRDPITGLWTIPYKGSNAPSLGSEFDDAVELMSFAIQDYLQNGIPYAQVHKVVAEMRAEAVKQMKGADPEHPPSVDETEAAASFRAFIKQVDTEEKLGSNPSLATFDTSRKVTQLLQVINGSAKGRLAFCRRYVLPQISQAMLQINSVSVDVPDIVSHFGGFTGTPWNLHSYHDKIHAEKSPGVDGRTWALMLSRNVEVETFDHDPKDPVGSVLNGLGIPGNYQAIIDTGAYLRGVTNEEYMNRYLTEAQNVGAGCQSGIYFNAEGVIVKKQGVEGVELPIEVAPETDLMANHTLYDQAHCVGADIKQGKTATAIVTVGENTFIRDLFQAVWRMRQLHQEQTVVLGVSEKVRELILGEDKNKALTVEDILKFCLSNESRMESEDNYRAEKSKIQSMGIQTMLKHVRNLVLHSSIPPAQMVELARRIAQDFTKQRPGNEVFDFWAQRRCKEDTLKILQSTKERCALQTLKTSESIAEMANGNADLLDMADELVKVAQEIESRQTPPREWFPDTIDAAAVGVGQEVEVEAQAEVELELQLEVLTQQEMETEVQQERVIEATSPSVEGAGGDVHPLDLDQIKQLIKKSGNPQGISTRQVDWESGMSCSVDQLRQLKSCIGLFDPEIYTSAVFERQLFASRHAKNYGKVGDPNVSALAKTLFYTNRKPVSDVLVVHVKGSHGDSGRWKLIVPTIHESQESCRQAVKWAQQKGYDAALVTVGISRPNIVFKTGDRDINLPFKSEADKKEFYRLYVQAKFFNGEISYPSKWERDALKEWLSRKDPVKCRDFFEQFILPAKPPRYEDSYPESALAAVFNEIC